MNDHAERRDASLQETLTAIDDAVLDRCVSCHQGLSPDAPSPWWCSPECQQAWSEQQVDNPREVLDRQDAAQVFVGMDAASVPLREAGVDMLRDIRAAQRLDERGWPELCQRGEHYCSIDNPCGIVRERAADRIRQEARREAGHHHTHCQHEAECCRCRGYDGCSHVRIRPGPYDSWAELRASWRRLTGSGGT